MSDLNSLVMSLDYSVLIPIGVVSTLGASFLAYKLLSSNKKNNVLKNETISNLDAPTQPMINEDTRTVDVLPIENKIESGKDDNLFSELLTESQESRLNENAINDFNNQFSNEDTKDSKIDPTLNNNLENTESVLVEQGTQEEFGNQNSLGKSIETESNHEQPIVQPSDSTQEIDEQEQLFQQLQAQSEKADVVQLEENQQYEHIVSQELQTLQSSSENKVYEVISVVEKNAKPISSETVSDNSILEHFGDLADTLHEEGQHHANRNKDASKVYDVWVNYMCMKNGKMNLQNLFVHLNSPWGTIEAISNLKEHIENEVGLDGFGNKQSWAVVSVLPLQN